MKYLPESGDVYLTMFVIAVLAVAIATTLHLLLAWRKAEPPKSKGRT